MLYSFYVVESQMHVRGCSTLESPLQLEVGGLRTLQSPQTSTTAEIGSYYYQLSILHVSSSKQILANLFLQKNKT